MGKRVSPSPSYTLEDYTARVGFHYCSVVLFKYGERMLNGFLDFLHL